MPTAVSRQARRARASSARGRGGRIRVLTASLAAAGALAAAPLGVTAAAAPRATAAAPRATAAAPRATAMQQIRANWIHFFSPTTPTARKIELLENGARFAGIIRATSTTVLARSTYAHVLAVQLDSPTVATVRYSISVAGIVAVEDATGTAVYAQRIWKVGELSYCSLLRIELIKAPSCPVGT